MDTQPARTDLPGEDHPYFLDSSEGEHVDFVGVHVTTKARAIDTGGLFGCTLFTAGPDTGAPPHHHTNDAELFYVLEGRIRCWLGDEERLTYPGDFGYIPAGTPHAFKFEGASNQMLGINFPGGFEDFFTQLGQKTDSSFPSSEPPPPPDLAEFARVAKELNWVLRPDFASTDFHKRDDQEFFTG